MAEGRAPKGPRSRRPPGGAGEAQRLGESLPKKWFPNFFFHKKFPVGSNAAKVRQGELEEEGRREVVPPPKFVSLNIYLPKFVSEGVTEAAVRQAGMEGGVSGGGCPLPQNLPQN